MFLTFFRLKKINLQKEIDIEMLAELNLVILDVVFLNFCSNLSRLLISFICISSLSNSHH